MELVISDASCIIALEDIGELRILKGLFSQVVVTDIVKDEIQAELPNWIKVSTDYEERELKILELELDTGKPALLP